MKSEKNILVAFLLNLFFSIFEIVGGVLTGSVAILSDALHDAGDAASIGLSYFLERKSKKEPDREHTYGYGRYSALGGVITTTVLLVGSAIVIIGAVGRIINPTPIDYNGMIIFAIVGVIVNFIAASLTHGGHSANERAVNLHMLEDVLGWAVVLVGAIVMKFVDLPIIDPIMSIGVSLFIFVNAIKNLGGMADLFLEKAPHGVCQDEIKEHLLEIEGVIDVHHIHLWSIDGNSSAATMHVVCVGKGAEIKKKVREELHEHGICHATIELEDEGEECIEIAPVRIKAVSSVGAGDSYGAAWLTAMLGGASYADAARLAARVSAFVVSCKEAVPDYSVEQILLY